MREDQVMTMASFQNWAGQISDIGPIYPMAGYEGWLFIIGLVAWIGWHILQIRAEAREYQDEIARFGKPETLRKIVDSEDPSNP
jgi:hypothetical protein